MGAGLREDGESVGSSDVFLQRKSKAVERTSKQN